MQVGLLGGTFFNNFTFQIDPASDVIVLYPNARVRAGLSQKQWSERFRALRGKIERLDNYVAQNQFTREARIRELVAKRAELDEALEELEREADRADVPQNWRQG